MKIQTKTLEFELDNGTVELPEILDFADEQAARQDLYFYYIVGSRPPLAGEYYISVAAGGARLCRDNMNEDRIVVVPTNKAVVVCRYEYGDEAQFYEKSGKLRRVLIKEE